MIQVPEDRRPPLTPQLARRVTIIGSFALAMFAIIFFRLWFLQVLNGHTYVAQAAANQVRSISTPAPRGRILDSGDNVLVSNTQELDVQIQPSSLPVKMTQANVYPEPAADMAVFRRLAFVLGISNAPKSCPLTVIEGLRAVRLRLRLAKIPCAVAEQVQSTPYADVTVKQNASADQEYYILEQQSLFPGVQVRHVYVRQYPLHQLAAQLFGTVGPISCNTPAGQKANANNCELKDPQFAGVAPTDVVGQSGLEYYYNRYLQGQDGKQNFQVDARGNFTGYLPGTAPRPGYDLKTGLDMNLQRTGQQALATSISSNPPSTAGSFVAMNPDTGQIYAMGSLPTFDPNVFTHPLTYAQYGQLTNSANGDPLLNRATQSVGPTGSTFKPITATAALQSGVWSVGETFDDTGQFCEGGGLCRRNAGGAAYGVIDLVQAIHVSDDVFFYKLGQLLNSQAPNGGALQTWARRYGIGSTTGVDLGGEDSGTLPDPAWRDQRNRLEAECDALTHPTATFPTHPNHSLPPGGCGIADGTNRPWSEGDNVNLAVGQGDVQVTPMQLAVAYAAIANGGNVVVPHVGEDIQTVRGQVVQRINPPPKRHLNIDPSYLDAIRQGLNEAAQAPGGTSYDVMGSFPKPVYGKTGTAQYFINGGELDYAWYACFVPDSATNRPILVVVHVEKGGFGDIAAAPVAREILNQWFFGKPGAYHAGGSRTL
jgi:penicillin-binding protein 2